MVFIDDEHYDKAQRMANKISESVAICSVDVGDSTKIAYYPVSELDYEDELFIIHVYAVVDFQDELTQIITVA